MGRFGQKTTKQVIDQVASNDRELSILELTNSASFRMKANENTIALAEALRTNTFIKKLVLRDCEIADMGLEAIGKMLEVNNTIEELDLQQNHITTNGVVALAGRLAKNKSLKALNILGQAQQVLGESCVESFMQMFQENITLVSIMWKVDSRRTWELSKLITRNVSIQKSVADGTDYSTKLPMKLRSDYTPKLSTPDVLQDGQPAVPPNAIDKASLSSAPTAPSSDNLRRVQIVAEGYDEFSPACVVEVPQPVAC